VGLFGRHSRKISDRQRSVCDAPDSAEAGSAALSGELPYLYCGEFRGFGPLHVLIDDTLGFAFEFDVPVVDTVCEGEASVSDTIARMLQALVPRVQWQWFFRTGTQVECELALYRLQSGIDEAGTYFSESFLQRWHEAQTDGFFPDSDAINVHPRTQRIVLALKSEPLGLMHFGVRDFLQSVMGSTVPSRPGFLARYLNGRSRAESRAQGFVDGVREVLSVAQAQGWSPRALDGTALIDFVGDLIFPQRKRQTPADIPNRPCPKHESPVLDDLRVQIANLGCLDAFGPSGFMSEAQGTEAHHRVVSMLWPPGGVAPGMLNEIASIAPVACTSVSASALGHTAALFQVKARALVNARSTHRFNETEMNERAEALHEVERRMFADGERIFEARIQIHVTDASADQADALAALVCRRLQALDFEAAVERDIGGPLLLRGCLPFGVYPLSERKFRRRRRLLTRDCADLHPAGGCWTGIRPVRGQPAAARRSPIVMYSNSSGQPLFIDPTKAEKNPHALVIGQSGSGKSFFVHDYLLHLWRLPDIRLFLISIKADYRKLALVLGKYVDIHLDSQISLNPFRGAPTLENQARWFAALVLMLSEGKDSHSISREAEIALQTASMTAAERNWNAAESRSVRETTLEDICLCLESLPEAIGRQLATHLQPYRRGPYRKLFNAPAGVRSHDRFVFFNLGSILGHPCAALASFCIFGLIDEVIGDSALRGVPKGLVADEVWALVRNPYAANILERSLKAYRSLGAFAVPIVQDPHDLDTPAGRVMLVNTATKIILPLDHTGLADVEKYVRLNEREREIVRDLRLVKRRFSEFFVSIDGVLSAKGLLIPDALRYAISTTDPSDESRLEMLYRECGCMLRAVKRFASESPFGLDRELDRIHTPDSSASADLAPRFEAA
jgi:hypothetical protein